MISLRYAKRRDGTEHLDEVIVHDASMHLEDMGGDEGLWCLVVESNGDRLMLNVYNVEIFEHEKSS